LLCSSALAAAGGGTSSFGGGGGGGGFSGGGGGFSGGGGSYGGGGSLSGGGVVVVLLLVGLFIVVPLITGLLAGARLRRKRQERVKRVTLAAAEAAADDAAFDADAVNEQAKKLFLHIQAAWDARDRARLRELVGDDLMVEWERRLDDFERKGWHNRVLVTTEPSVEYVGLVNRLEDEDDRVCVRVEAMTKDYVETRDGARVMHTGQASEDTQIKEYWTLEKRADETWRLLSIEQDAEGVHNLDAEIIAAPEADSRIHDEAVAERAAADAAPAGVSPAELVDVDFSGPARAKAMDLSLADGRFDVDLIETSVRRAVAAWADAVDGADTDLEAVARPGAVRALLGDAGGRTRTVIRGPRVEGVTITALDAEATPATLTVELNVRARRYVEDRDTVALVSGSRDAETTFTEHWTLALDAEGEWPWRIAVTQPSAA
jgi:predicted lipid-binding transport protein (Tim44 family)